MNDIQKRLMIIALDVNSQASLKDAADLDRKFAEIGLDSLEAMSVMLAAMEYFGAEIADEEVDGIATLNQLARLLETRAAAPGSEG